jgi:hypothetical protein
MVAKRIWFRAIKECQRVFGGQSVQTSAPTSNGHDSGDNHQDSPKDNHQDSPKDNQGDSNKPSPSPLEHEELLFRPSFHDTPLPPEAVSYLQYDNPRLIELENIYKSLSMPVTKHSLWTDQFQRGAIELQYFRGDNAYAWQYRGERNIEVVALKYLLVAYYIQKIDRLGLLPLLREDPLFGVYTFDFNGQTVSRDLLDSIVEIYFLERNLGISNASGIRILDIGAGYGRLAHRIAKALPNLGQFYCTDAVAVSTFISEYYLHFRQVDDKVTVIPLNEIEKTLQENEINLAVNMHSFSECTLEAITWWINLLAKNRVKYLFIVPNDGPVLLSREPDDSHLDFRPVLEANGYRLKVAEPKYLDPSIQRHGVHPAQHYLFELVG